MSQLIDLLRTDEDTPPVNALDPKYQGNMYLIESALREVGAEKSSVSQVRTPYDEELMRLIDAVPLR